MNPELALNFSFELDASFKTNISRLQDQAVFIRRYQKATRLKAIAEKKPFQNDWPIVTERKWAPLLGDGFEYIETDFFEDLEGGALHEKKTFLQNKVLIVSSAVPQSGGAERGVRTLLNYATLYDQCPNTLFVGWDWDNHHHLGISLFFANASDIYCPSHRANDYELSRMCAHQYRIPASSHQWGREFLNENLPIILRRDRISDVLGIFVRYGIFAYRNQLVHTLSKKLDHVRLVDDLGDYWALSAVERLDWWTRFKAHWIVPTLNDVSTRVFDALITGGVVIVHESFKNDSLIAALHPQDCIFYSDLDVFEPERVVRSAVAAFDQGGLEGVIRRYRRTVEFHNLDVRLASLTGLAERILGAV